MCTRDAGYCLRGEGEAADANAAFDDAAEHIAKRLRRYRRRVNDHARDIANRARPEAARQFVLQEAENGLDGAEPNRGSLGEAYATVIAETQTEIATLSVGEAVMQMDLADQMVVMFRNSVSRQLNVVYRRPDGHIGWIDPGSHGVGDATLLERDHLEADAVRSHESHDQTRH